MSKSPDHIANPLRNTWRYRIAAWLTGGTVYEFQSHVGNSEWKRGLCILSPEAFDAHISVFRVGATFIADSGLVKPEQP